MTAQVRWAAPIILSDLAKKDGVTMHARQALGWLSPDVNILGSFNTLYYQAMNTLDRIDWGHRHDLH
ncbi:hypothetical protein KVP09_13535 [Alcaligenaceae bacterium CGII-47]|nr:hypothetical protein [Alcaligenaceae bacterium CGII-47]